MTSTGIFLCTCDQKINKGVDVRRVAEALGAEAIVKTVPHACLPDGIKGLQQEIVENNLERVVVAACPRRYQEKRLQESCLDAGINLNRFALVDWREGCAWAHRADKEGATAKAIDLVRMGLGRVTHARALDGVLTKVTPRALVVGGGIAGLTAGLALAERDVDVTLVEREPVLGGQLLGFPLNGEEKAFQDLRFDVLRNPKIETRLSSHVGAVHGQVGSYHVVIAGAAGGEIDAGAVVIATGSRELRDPGQFHYDGRNVTTLGEVEKQIHNSEFRVRNSIVYVLCAGSRDEHIRYCSNTCCLGALNQAIRLKKANPTAQVTILFRDLYLLGEELNEEVVREARRLGVAFVRYANGTPPVVEEDFVVAQDSAGISHWIGYDRLVLATAQVPREDAGSIASLFKLDRDDDGFFPDPHWRLRPEQQNERGVYVCGSAHRPVDRDSAVLQGLTAAAHAARFIQAREIMRPSLSASVDSGLCTGCAQCIGTCPVCAISLVPKPLSPNSPTLREVQQVREGAGETGLRSVIDPFLCLGCGNCVAACPTKAIDLPSASDAQIFAQIDSALGGEQVAETGGKVDKETARQGDLVSASSRPRVIIFGCQWSGFAAMELAGARRSQYSPDARVIELPCSARLDPMHVLYALLTGARSVVLALCPPNECHFGSGNRYAEARIENLRSELAAHGIDPQRLQVARMMGDDAGAWVKAVEQAVTRKVRVVA